MERKDGRSSFKDDLSDTNEAAEGGYVFAYVYGDDGGYKMTRITHVRMLRRENESSNSSSRRI